MVVCKGNTRLENFAEIYGLIVNNGGSFIQAQRREIDQTVLIEVETSVAVWQHIIDNGLLYEVLYD